ncbi:pirin family protein [Danxiaibacter flavus]|uniref:Pirin family protein n=1 Tax=Danxiaibacter flavus TaxID=3049108 RepID=A0ABV3ZJK6_9BACT|nr:pirin family protein [Chitinophagaceae bacterium DXS]
MAQYIYHKADTRGHDHHEWLDSKKTFSFGDYYNPERMGFGALRVLNDDTLPGRKGFGSHPHDNMEIISIPLKGSLVHEDSVGNKAIAATGSVQVMHAGSGLFHSEYNNSVEEEAEFLQIWIYPEDLNTSPRYTLGVLPLITDVDVLHTFIGPGSLDGLTVRKDTWFSYGVFSSGHTFNYVIRKAANGIDVFVISGSFFVDGKLLSQRDGMGIRNATAIDIETLGAEARLLVIEIPMDIHDQN